MMRLNHKFTGFHLIIEPCIFGKYSAFLTVRNGEKAIYSAHKISFDDCIQYAKQHGYDVPVGF